MKKLELNQPVYLKTINNEARSGTKIIETKIVTIGKKYFYVENYPQTKFRILDLQQETDFCRNYEVYFDKQTILDELEANKIYNNIRKYFESYSYETITINLSLDKLQKISEILETN